MFAEIITIGDEILIGQIVDTNSAFIAKELNDIGISVYQISSVQDSTAHILSALKEAEQRADLVIITGGLGPTKDDITKHTLCTYLNDTLVLNKDVLRNVEELFEKYIGKPMSALNKDQALVLSKAEVLTNEWGTAPGMWMQHQKTVFISLPGVPFEMKNLITHQVLPRLQKRFDRPHIIHKTILTSGIGESDLADKIEDWENKLPDFIKLAYLPSLGSVRLRLSAKGADRLLLKEGIKKQVSELYLLIGDIIYGEDDEASIAIAVKDAFVANKKTLATAESFTGGKIAEQLTAIPGASQFFKGSVVSYATETKIEVLNVPKLLIEKDSVVSASVAEAMAINVRKLLKTDVAVATTGNAGPTKGDSNVEIGTVFIAIATSKGVYSEKFNMGKHRERVVNKGVNKALELLQKEILNF